MPEVQTRPALERKTTRTAEHDPSAAGIWGAADGIVRTHLVEAHGLVSQDTTPTHDRMVQLARAAAVEELQAKKRAGASKNELNPHRIAVALLGVPAGTRAQRALDNSGRSKNEMWSQRSAASRFNAEFGAAIVDLPSEALTNFPTEFIHRARALGRAVNQPVFEDREFEPVVRGVKGEVAMKRAIEATKPDDWQMIETDVANDLAGVDLRIRQGRKVVDIDAKATHAFDEKIADLKALDLLSEEEHDEATVSRYAQGRSNNSRANNGNHFVVDYGCFGPMAENGFEYQRPERVTQFIAELIDEVPDPSLRNMGYHAINS